MALVLTTTPALVQEYDKPVEAEVAVRATLNVTACGTVAVALRG
jgi:hypothetical protein